MCGNKKSKFIKQQEASRLLGSLEIRARLRKIPNLHISQNLHIVPLDRLQKTKREYKSLKKQGIYNIFIKTNQKKLALNMTWFMEILKI